MEIEKLLKSFWHRIQLLGNRLDFLSEVITTAKYKLDICRIFAKPLLSSTGIQRFFISDLLVGKYTRHITMISATDGGQSAFEVL